jgi:hypothetical protein
MKHADIVQFRGHAIVGIDTADEMLRTNGFTIRSNEPLRDPSALR